MSKPTTLALVPARGGSKSIPFKNLKHLGGRPLLHWVLAAARASDVVDRVCVSTDDRAIASAAAAGGAEVPFLRPAELATDDASTLDVVEHALRWLDDNEGALPELVLLLQPTEPFVRPAQIRDALALMHERGADTAITVVEVPRNNHPYHVRLREELGWLRFEHPELHYAHPTRQQDPPRWAFANLYWFRSETFLHERRLEVDRTVGLPVDSLSALDLNTPEDWTLAEAVVQAGFAP